MVYSKYPDSGYFGQKGEIILLLGVLLGLGIPAAVVYYFMLGGKEKLALYLFNQKSLAAKVKSLFKKDMSSKCARSTFYMNNDYDNGYSQSEWLKLFKESITDKEWDINSEEYAEAVAPFINAVVVDDTGYYLRRGMENLDRAYERFLPGVNDQISLNHFVEPYKYYKHKITKQTQAEQNYKDTSAEKGSSPLASMNAQRELFFAQKRHRDAVYNHKRFKGSSLETFYELQEKEAYAALLSAQAKYDSRK